MDNIKELTQTFSIACPGASWDKDSLLEEYLGWLLAHELALNENMYDQPRYDLVFDGLQRAFDWSRMDLHKRIIEARESLRHHPEPATVFRNDLSEEAKRILLLALDRVVLAACTDKDFRKYLNDKIASKIDANGHCTKS